MRLLGLLHPRGDATRVAYVAAEGARASQEAVDLAIAYAPTRRAAAACAAVVATDGIVVALGPGRSAAGARRLLSAQGLRVDAVFGIRRSSGQALGLLPLDAHALAHAATTYGAAPPALVALVRRALNERTLALVASAVPRVAVVARHADAPPLLAWLDSGHRAPATHAIILGSWRGPRGSAVIDLAPTREHPRLIAKITFGAEGAARATAEAQTLQRLGRGAEAAGARVPTVIRLALAGERPVIVEDAVPGTPANQVLRLQPARLRELLHGIATWLERWGLATRTPRQDAAILLDESLSLGPPFDRDLARRVRGQLHHVRLPLVATHGDLTAANVLVAGRGAIGVVDWQTARVHGLPIGDLAYATVDAVRIAGRYPTVVAAYDACFGRSTGHGQLVGCLHRSLAAALGLSPAETWAALCASWLEHAANEASTADGRAERPFLEIARRAVGSGIPPALAG